jgi:osmoprotectant transport system permease protein
LTLLGAAGDEPLVDWDWVDRNRDDIWELTIEHLTLTGLAVGIGFAIAMVMALVALRWRWTYGPLAGFCGVLYSIPSLALFGLLIPITGLGLVPAEIALVSYTLLILLRNIVAGVDGVPPAVREAADGMGYERWRRLVGVDLPLALPAIVAGLRIATVTTIGLVTVTALAGEGGYGDLIKDGLSRRYFPTPIVVGTTLSIAMAVAFDLLFVTIGWLAAPWARSRGRGRSARRPAAPAATGVRTPATPALAGAPAGSGATTGSGPAGGLRQGQGATDG